MVSDALLELIGDTHSLLDLDEFRVELLGALARAVPAEWVSLNDIGPDPDDTVVLADPEPPAELLEPFARYAHQNPMVGYHSTTLDGRPRRFSDLISQRELHALDLYREVYAELGVEYQIAFTLPSERGRVLGIALSRSDGASERTTAERLGISHRTVQKHLERCYRQLGVSSRSQAAVIAWGTAEPWRDGYSGSPKPASSAASPGSSSAA